MITLNKNLITLKYDDENAYINSLVYDGKEYVGGCSPIFTLALRSVSTKQTRLSSFDYTLIDSNVTDNEFTCKYRNGDIYATVSAKITDEIEWNLKLSKAEGFAYEFVNFPYVITPNDLRDSGGDSKILWGFNEGVLIDNLSMRENGWPYFEPEYPSRGIAGVFPAIVETQFMAYYNNHSGLYFATHDANNGLKGVNFVSDNGGIKFEFRHFTGADFDADYEIPYPTVMKFFKGDWRDASEIYKKWFKANSAKDFIEIDKNEKLPNWYKESPVIITYPVRGVHDTDVMNPNAHFPYINVMPEVEKYEKLFGSKIMVLLMHWEGTAPWCPPIVWPPYGGEEEFKKLVDALHERGDVIGVYCSGLGWTIQSHTDEVYNTIKQFEEENLQEEMCLSPEQTLPYSNICRAQRSGYDLCPTRDFTIKTITEQVELMAGAGIDYIQLMDQNHGGTSYFCYSKKHNHPPVPGKWQVDAVKQLLQTASKNTTNVLFGCESAAAESYIPELLFSDNRFILNYRVGSPVPCYAYVYHEYVNNFMGNQVCANAFIDRLKNPLCLAERVAYSFVAGDMLTAVLTVDGKIDWSWGKANKEVLPDQNHICALIKNLNYWRQVKPEFLNTGSMVKPIDITCEILNFEPLDRDEVFLVPSVHTSAFESKNGKYAQFMANFTDAEKTVTFTLDSDGYVLKGYDFEKPLTKGLNSVTIPPASAYVLEK